MAFWNRSVRRAGRALLPLALGGCLLGPDAPPEVAALPGDYVEKPAESPGAVPVPPEASADGAFWRDLGDPLLVQCVERALSDSPDVARATAKIRESRALSGAAWAALFPELQGGASAERIRLSTESPFLSQAGISRIPGFSPEANDWKGSLSMAYELDVWGRNRRAAQSAFCELEGDVEKRRSVGLTLAGEVSSAYIDYRTLEGRRSVAAQLLEGLKSLRTIARDRAQGGLASDLDVARADTEIANAEASVIDLGRLLTLTEHRLSVLTGSPPGTLRKTLEGSKGSLRSFDLPPGLPSQLLSRRPDLRELSDRLRAATARVGQAKADLLPRIVLSGEIGSESVDFSKLTSRGAIYWTAGPSLQIPLFDWGRRRDTWTAAEERADQSLQELESQVLTALLEVEDGLANVREDKRRRSALQGAADAARRASRIAFDKYGVGLVSQLDVIDAERIRLQAEDALLEGEARVLHDAVGLAKALGGGFRAAERAMPPLPAPEKE
ncbi:MAG TPA: efflux transporter outer membrane subunit [Planctomycetota bacterium]|nr:efflux transporter outer membrane subunit [Planctomycetota bacterium]